MADWKMQRRDAIVSVSIMFVLSGSGDDYRDGDATCGRAQNESHQGDDSDAEADLWSGGAGGVCGLNYGRGHFVAPAGYDGDSEDQ